MICAVRLILGASETLWPDYTFWPKHSATGWAICGNSFKHFTVFFLILLPIGVPISFEPLCWGFPVLSTSNLRFYWIVLDSQFFFLWNEKFSDMEIQQKKKILITSSNDFLSQIRYDKTKQKCRGSPWSTKGRVYIF